MLKKFILFCLVVGGIVYFVYTFIDSGRCKEFILTHKQSSWAPASLYYLGIVFLILQKQHRAEEIYKKFIETFQDRKYYESAFYRYYYIAASDRRVKEAAKRGMAFIKKFPDNPKIDRIKKRIHVLEDF